MILPRLIISALVLVATTSAVGAPLIVHDGGWTEVVRATGYPVFPLTVASDGSVYFVTGTAPGDHLHRVNTDGSVDTLYSTGGVIGTVADLEIAFGGDLFANDGSPRGVRRFGIESPSNTTFWASPLVAP